MTVEKQHSEIPQTSSCLLANESARKPHQITIPSRPCFLRLKPPWNETPPRSRSSRFFTLSSFSLSINLHQQTTMSSSSSSYEIILTSSPDGPVMAYDASTGAYVARFTGSRSPRRGLAVVGKRFIAAAHVSPDTEAVSIHLYNWFTSSVFYSFRVPEFVAPLAATSDGGYIFAGGQSGSIHSFSLPAGDSVRSFSAHTKPVSCLQLSDDGSLVISGTRGRLYLDYWIKNNVFKYLLFI